MSSVLVFTFLLITMIVLLPLLIYMSWIRAAISSLDITFRLWILHCGRSHPFILGVLFATLSHRCVASKATLSSFIGSSVSFPMKVPPNQTTCHTRPTSHHNFDSFQMSTPNLLYIYSFLVPSLCSSPARITEIELRSDVELYCPDVT